MVTGEETDIDVANVLRARGSEQGTAEVLQRIEHESDSSRRESLKVQLGRALADRGDYQQATALLTGIDPASPQSAGARIGLAAIAMRQKRFDAAKELLAEAERGQPARIESAEIAHLRGTIHFHLSQDPEARTNLLRAAELFEKDSIGFARVMDTLGMLFAGMSHFNSARSSFKAALAAKLRPDSQGNPVDEEGAAFTYGSLGRLYLEWGYLDESEVCFKFDLHIARRNDARAVAQIRNHLGIIESVRGNWASAAKWLDEAIANAVEGKWSTLEAFARKDRARAAVHLRDIAGAEQHLRLAEPLLTFTEGQAHLHLVWGEALRASGRFDDAREMFRKSAAEFDSLIDFAWGARARLEEARLPSALDAVLKLLFDALRLAEQSRRTPVIREVEQELRKQAPEQHARRMLRRFQGTGANEGPSVLMAGARERLSVLFMDIVDSTKWVAATDPLEVTLTLDEVFGEIEAACARHGGDVENYLGDGMLVLFRKDGHEKRSVAAALDVVTALDELNSLRRCLGQFEIKPRIGVATGDAIVGFMGTYQKMTHNVIGATVNRAARIQSESEPGKPCISAETQAAVHDAFDCKGPRLCTLKGFSGPQEIWEVAARRDRRVD